MCNLPCAFLLSLLRGNNVLLWILYSAWAEALTHPPRTWSVGQRGTCAVLSHQDLGLLDTAIQYSTTTISHHYLPPLPNAYNILLISPDPREDTLLTVYDPPSSSTPRTALTMPTYPYCLTVPMITTQWMSGPRLLPPSNLPLMLLGVPE